MNPTSSSFDATLVALQFLMYAFGWATGGRWVHEYRAVFWHWGGFLTSIGLGFGLMSLRDDSRSWIAFNGSALAWLIGLLLLWRDLALFVQARQRSGWQLALLLFALLAHLALGPGLESPASLTVATYTSTSAALLLLTLYCVMPAALREYGTRSVLLLALPAGLLLAARLVPLLLQALDMRNAQEIHLLGPRHRQVMIGLFVAAGMFNLLSQRWWCRRWFATGVD